MSEHLKKSRSQIVSSPFLLRFSGKLNQLSKQGTMTHHSQILNEPIPASKKHNTAILQKNGQNSLMSLEQIRHKNQDQFQNNSIHSPVRSAFEQSTHRKKDYPSSSRNHFQFLSSVYLHGKCVSEDFQSMLSLLNQVEQAKKIRS